MVPSTTSQQRSNAMHSDSAHKIELFTPEVFKIMLDHEVNKSRRYGDSLTLIDLLIETDPADLETLHNAEALAIHLLDIHLRDSDIPCQRENEFLILMPSTSAPGARTACERIRRLMDTEYQTNGGTPFKLFTFIGMAAMPTDHSLSSDDLSQNASQALQHARSKHLMSVVAFTEIQK
jgi:hypothetical protein